MIIPTIICILLFIFSTALTIKYDSYATMFCTIFFCFTSALCLFLNVIFNIGG